MNKRFLLQLVLLFSALGAFAVSAGDYIYTPDARFKVSGTENLVVNGSFSNADYTNAQFGWYNAAMGTISSDYWTIKTGEGPDGQNVIESLSAAEGVVMCQLVPYKATKSYVVSLKIKGPSSTTSSVTEGSANYIDMYTNFDASISKTADGFMQVATAEGIGSDWTEISFAFTDTVSNGGKDGFLVISLGRLTTGTQVTDVQMWEVSQVYDTRVIERKLAYYGLIAGSGEFTTGVTEFQKNLGQVQTMLDANYLDDNETALQVVEALDDAYASLLDANTSDALQYITNGNVSSWSKFNCGDGKTSIGDWQFSGKDLRWGHAADATEAKYEFPGGGTYTLGWGQAKIVKSGMNAGRYMFTMDAKAFGWEREGSTSNYYLANYGRYSLDGTKLFLGKDTTDCGVLPTRYYGTYTVFGDLAEGEDLDAGIYFAGFEAGGGAFNFENVSLRMVGVSASELEHMQYINAIITQQNALNERLDLAAADLAGTLPWGRADLQDSLTKYTEVYQASLAYVDAEGNEVGVDIPENYDATLLEAVRAMNSARNNFSSVNAPYVNLVDYVAEAETLINDEKYANVPAASKTSLQTAINNSKTLIAGVTSEPQTDEFTQSLADLQVAVTNFKMDVASKDLPAEIIIVNGDFATKSATGWTTITDATSNAYWKFAEDDRFEGNYRIYSSKGNTYWALNKAQQTVNVSRKGLYAYVCQAYAVNTSASNYAAMWNGLEGADSLRLSGVKLFFGQENIPDSANVCTYQETFGNNIWEDALGEIRYYTLYFEKQDDVEMTLEFGMDALENGVPMGVGCNLYGFGSNHIYYFGDADAYWTGISAVATENKQPRNSAVYTLTGIKVADSMVNLPKGIYISGGKKFVVK